MPDKRKHRGQNPQDQSLFSKENLFRLKSARADLSWLFGRGYSEKSALSLVGDRWKLESRQRHAVRRVTCSEDDAIRRQAKRIESVSDSQCLHIDGFNVLITVEAALSVALILVGQDGAYRDIASMHGTFRVVEETHPAINLIGQTLQELKIQNCCWYFDRPVSNSGRISKTVEEIARANKWNWTSQLEFDPDKVLGECSEPISSSDSLILDRCENWVNLTAKVVEKIETAWVVNLCD